MLDKTIISGPNRGRKPVTTGRPRIPLLAGQKLYIERAYGLRGYSQARIAQELDIAIPRVRRHLIDSGLYIPRSPQRTAAREKQLSEAVQAYIDGELVVGICQEYLVNPAELYRLLRADNIPFRTQRSDLPDPAAAQTPVLEEVTNG